MYKIQDVLKKGLEHENLYLTYQQENTVRAILNCKTGAMGGHTTTCFECGHETIHYNSCRNRHCPCCQTIVKEKWIDKTSASLVDGPYFHVVFTLPHDLNAIFLSNQKIMYNLLYRLSGETLKELALDPKYKLEAEIGFISILHTWGSDLSYHPHVHIICLAGGLNKENTFVQKKGNFLFPFDVMGKLFRGKFLDYLDNLWRKNKLNYKPISDANFIKLKNKLYKTKWIPYAKKTFFNAKFVIEYLGRYTHRIAISNSRIISYTDETITFEYKHYKSKKKKVMTLYIGEFTRRFLLHILPKRFVKIRYYGILCNRKKTESLLTIRHQTGSPEYKPKLKDMTTEEILNVIFNIDITKCSNCNCSKISRKYFDPKKIE